MKAVCAVLALMLAACQPMSPESAAQFPSIEVSFTPEASTDALDGRLILILAKSTESEPRHQVRPGVNAVQIFGIDVQDMAAGEQVVIDDSAFGYPYDSLDDLPDGEYFVQALLHKYDTFELASGHVVQLQIGRAHV